MTTATDLTVFFEPNEYHHWEVSYDGPTATVSLVVEPETVTVPGYVLKSNSYDLGVYIELADIVERMRFEHPEVGVVVLTSGVEGVFCAGANISMLAGSTHGHKVNFCKFTNETLNAIEDASTNSEQVWIASLNGTAAGGGYEMALACDEILMVDDRAATVALPEVPLLGVLPGTGGLTRLVDKRKVRRDRADVFSTKAEGVRAKRAIDWGIVDTIAARSVYDDALAARVAERSGRRLGAESGVTLEELGLKRDETGIFGRFVSANFDESSVEIVISGPDSAQPIDPEEAVAAGSDLWLLTAARELDNILLELRFNETTRGTLVVRTEGDPEAVVSAEKLLVADHWYARELGLYWARTLRRLDLSARSIICLVLPGSCFAGVLAELAWAADRTLMLDGEFNDDAAAPSGEASLTVTASNDGAMPMANGLSRLQSRFYGDEAALKNAIASKGVALDAESAFDAGLVLDIPDDLDWHDEVRLIIEERISFSPDALTGMEASLRFVGPETVETKIFGRLTAWQNWIFQRPNAAGPNGALRSYGSGHRPEYNQERV